METKLECRFNVKRTTTKHIKHTKNVSRETFYNI